jgi:hypothetical protein
MPQLPAGVSFWGAVGAVMTVLHIKDRFDDCECGFTENVAHNIDTKT